MDGTIALVIVLGPICVLSVIFCIWIAVGLKLCFGTSRLEGQFHDDLAMRRLREDGGPDLDTLNAIELSINTRSTTTTILY